jgi:homoserine kinase
MPNASYRHDPSRRSSPELPLATVRVPGSTSNLGAGFDCVGMAVDRWLTARVWRDPTQPGPRLVRGGTLQRLAIEPEQDLIWQGITAACTAARVAPPQDLVIEASSDIPVGSGLGSSAAAVVAGVAIATAVLALPLDAQAIAAIAAALEGHPDNVVPSVFGGAMLAVARAGEPLVVSPLEVHPSLAFAFAIPDFVVPTASARAALPPNLPHAVAVAAAGRSAALVHGLATGDARLLAIALDDVLHVPYRRGLVRGYDAVVAAAIRAGAFGATLSGAGSGLVAIAPCESRERVAQAMAAAWSEHGVSAATFHITTPASGYEVHLAGGPLPAIPSPGQSDPRGAPRHGGE